MSNSPLNIRYLIDFWKGPGGAERPLSYPAARERAIELFSLPAMIRWHSDLYDSLFQQAKGIRS